MRSAVGGDATNLPESGVRGSAVDSGGSCPACGGDGIVDLPASYGVDEFTCPVCHPWAEGFPGLTAHGRYIIGPAKRGERATWYGDSGPLVNDDTERSGSHPARSAERPAVSGQDEG